MVVGNYQLDNIKRCLQTIDCPDAGTPLLQALLCWRVTGELLVVIHHSEKMLAERPFVGFLLLSNHSPRHLSNIQLIAKAVCRQRLCQERRCSILPNLRRTLANSGRLAKTVYREKFLQKKETVEKIVY